LIGLFFFLTAEKKNETTKKQLDRLARESDLMMREFAELGNGVVSRLFFFFPFFFFSTP